MSDVRDAIAGVVVDAENRAAFSVHSKYQHPTVPHVDQIIAIVREALLSDDVAKAAALGGLEEQGPITWVANKPDGSRYGAFDSDDWMILSEAMMLGALDAAGLGAPGDAMKESERR